MKIANKYSDGIAPFLYSVGDRNAKHANTYIQIENSTASKVMIRKKSDMIAHIGSDIYSLITYLHYLLLLEYEL